VSRTYRVILLDLFGTVVHFVPGAAASRGGLEWLRDPLTRLHPNVAFDDFRRALIEVSSALVAERALAQREIPSRERFRRTLQSLGVNSAGDGSAGDVAETLSLAHMTHLAAQTELPPAHLELLNDLAGRYRLGLVSNFDHAPTAHAILSQHGVRGCFAATVISDEFGRRKPHPAIFHAALNQLDISADEALFVGDTPADDVCGAQAVGLDVAWLNRQGADVPDPAPTYTLRELTELRGVLGRRH
jgi:putative hydrolase of the HAD superfamily